MRVSGSQEGITGYRRWGGLSLSRVSGESWIFIHRSGTYMEALESKFRVSNEHPYQGEILLHSGPESFFVETGRNYGRPFSLISSSKDRLLHQILDFLVPCIASDKVCIKLVPRSFR